MYIVSRRKITVVVFLLFFMSNIYLLTILKVLFMDPRPFMYSLKVQQLQWKCPAEYGNPSGHSFLVFQFYACLVFDLISRVNKNIWLMAVPCTMAVLIPQSRMYLGAHSSNQVILGLVLGLCMQVLYRYSLQRKIYDLINSLVVRKSLETLLLLIAANISLNIIALWVYERQIKYPFPLQYLNFMEISCPEVGSVTRTQFLIHNFSSSSMINIVFGMLFGVFCSRGESYRYLYGQWHYRNPQNKWSSRLFRIALELLPALCSVVLLYWLIPKHIVNVYLKFFVQGIGAWVTGFFLIVFTHNLLMYYGVIIQNRREEGPIRSHYDC